MIEETENLKENTNCYTNIISLGFPQDSYSENGQINCNFSSENMQESNRKNSPDKVLETSLRLRSVERIKSSQQLQNPYSYSNSGPLKIDVSLPMSNRSSGNLLRVLLCDDEALIKKTLTRFLGKFSQEITDVNFDIHEAENGFECLNKVYEYYSKGMFFDILIIDETMPLLKGSQIVNLIKTMISENSFKVIKIISYTSYNHPDKVEYIYSQGADHVLTKPISYENFREFIISQNILTN